MGERKTAHTSLTDVRILSRYAPHVGHSAASGSASGGRSQTPLSTDRSHDEQHW